jgi:hypothetical protein
MIGVAATIAAPTIVKTLLVDYLLDNDRALDEEAVRLAVAAHARHAETPYNALLAAGCDRHEARRQVAHQIRSLLDTWQRP